MRIDRRQFLLQGGASSLSVLIVSGQSSQSPETLTCPMHPEIVSRQPGKCPKCGMKLTPRPLPSAWSCTMHPEIQSPDPGICPRCRMRLTRIGQADPRDFTVRIETSPSPPQAGKRLNLRFTVYHPDHGRQIRKFNILHDMPFHLFVVSQDFESFSHLHPELQRDGSLILETVLPRPGDYLVFCDFFPEGGMPQVAHQHLITAGYRGDVVGSLPSLEPDQPVDGRLVKVVDGTRFELAFEPANFYAGEEFDLHYRLFDAHTGRPVEDLHPYLAAWGHTLILSQDGTEYLHSHPSEMLPEGLSFAEQRQLRGRSEVVFETFFPRPSRYRIWSQFQRGERLVTVAFNIEVPRLQ
jgi:hypothetical protein